jgi:hypothetical protein
VKVPDIVLDERKPTGHMGRCAIQAACKMQEQQRMALFRRGRGVCFKDFCFPWGEGLEGDDSGRQVSPVWKYSRCLIGTEEHCRSDFGECNLMRRRHVAVKRCRRDEDAGR